MSKQKAVFLDRDGTIIEEVNFLSKVEETKLFPFTIEALKILRDAGFIFFITTNQSGIARGYFDATHVNAIHAKIQNELKVAGLQIESFHFCPHMPDAGCRCRKPNTGMIEQAGENFDIDLSESWMVGDKILDIGMGFKAGTKTALVKTGYGEKHQFELERNPDKIVDNLLKLAEYIRDNS